MKQLFLLAISIVFAFAFTFAIKTLSNAEEIAPARQANAASTRLKTPDAEVYQKKPTLAATMTAARAAYREFQQKEAASAKNIKWGDGWLSVQYEKGSPKAALFAPGTFDPQAKDANNKPFWNKQKSGQSKLVAPEDERIKESLFFYSAEVESLEKTSTRVGILGGDTVELWCNGILVGEISMNYGIEDYWWFHEKNFVYAGLNRYQRLVELPLEKGKNLIQLRVRQKNGEGRPAELQFVTRPNLSQQIWWRLRSDFPEACEGFLDVVPVEWFQPGASNWFVIENTAKLEAAFAAELVRASNVKAQGLGIEALIQLSEEALLRKKLGSLGQAVDELARLHGAAYPARDIRAKMAALTANDNWRKAFSAVQREALVTRNPLLADAKIVFVKHLTYAPYHYYDEYSNSLGARFGKSNLSIFSLKDGSVRDLLPGMGNGIFDRFDLSFDAQRIVFGYQNPKAEGMRLYEVRTDGSGLRQLTFAPSDEPARMARYNLQPLENLATNFTGNSTGYGHWTDDMHPAYLPDGRIVFVSTRVEQSVLCGGQGGQKLTINNLHRINSDGSGLTRLSHNPLHELAPSVLNDGRILYNRWEYVDKGVGGCQPLWSMRPDGTGKAEVYGNNITNPGVFMDGRAIPGRSDLLVCTASAHEMLSVGPLLLIDRTKDKRDYSAMKSLTPDVEVVGMRARNFQRNGQMQRDIYGSVWCHPFPLNDSFFLAAGNGGGFLYKKTGFGLYLIDRFGNRVLLHEEAGTSCWQPMLLAPRTAPRTAPDRLEASAGTPATLFLSDVNMGLEKYGVKRGEVKYLRVWEYVARPWSAYNPWGGDSDWAQMAVISKHTHLWVQVLLGIVPVNEDGSAVFEVPSERSIFLQALDKDFQEIHRMRTPMDFRPGEKYSCIGCHEYQGAPPAGKVPMAMRQQPAKLVAQPGETAPRPIHYVTDVQPILDRKCISCHSGNDPKGKLDLSGTLTKHFNKSYEQLIDLELVEYIQEFGGPRKGHGAMRNIEVIPPKKLGSHASKLVELLRKGHHDVQLSQEEWIKLVTWIDANAPYYGSYFGRRNLKWKDHPDFRPVPDVNSARGIEPAWLKGKDGSPSK